MRTLIALLLSTLPLLASPNTMQGVQFCPLRLNAPTNASVQAWYDPNSPLNTLNGAGMSQLKNLAPDAFENWLKYSDDFSSGWTRSDVNAFGATDTGAAGAGSFANTTRTLDPFGGNTADFVQEDLVNTAHFIFQTITDVSSAPIDYEVYLKAAGRTWGWLVIGYSGGAESVSCYYDLSLGVLGTLTTTAGLVGSTASIQSSGNGWYKCTIHSTGFGGGAQVDVLLADADSSTGYAGDNTSGLFIYGAQLRRATKSPTYVKTEAIRYVVEDRDLNQSTGASQPLLSRADNRGNLLTYSDGFDQWSLIRLNAFGVTDTGAAGAGSFANTSRTTDPLGGNTAEFIQEDSAANGHYFQQINAGLPAASFTYSVSIKAAGRDWCILFCEDPDNLANNAGLYFNVATGTAGTTSFSGGAWTRTASSITSQGNGWYLCSVTFSTANTGRITTAVYFATGDGTFSYTGDNTSGLFIYGASLRQSSWSSDYIATTSTPAYPGQNGSRVLVFDGTDDYMKTATFPLVQPETVVGVFDATSMTSSAFDVFDGFSNSESGTLYVFNDPPPSAKLYAGAFSADQALVLGTNYVFVSVFNSASSALTLNSNTVGGDSGTQSMNGFTVGRRADGSQYFCGNIADLLILNRVLTSAEQSYLVQGLARKAGVNVW